MEFQALKRMTTSHRCAICHAPLILPWDAEANDYRLVCGQHREHKGYERKPTMAQECQERERQMREPKPQVCDEWLDELF